MKAAQKIYCYDCEKPTNQEFLFTTAKKEKFLDYDKDKDVIEIEQKTWYSVIRCLGCGTHSFAERHSYSNDLNEKDEPIVYITTYPDANEFENEEEDGFFLAIEELKCLPPLIKRLYKEIIVAFRNDLDILAGIGLRALIEAICIHRNIKGRNLKEKIENLHMEGYISQKQIPVLQKLREIGNSTVHQIEKPSITVLDNALGVVNHTLRTVYYVPRMDAKIKHKQKVNK